MLTSFEAFSGYGSQSMSGKKYCGGFESVGISEVDESAIISYAAVHCEDREVNFPPVDKMLEVLISCNIGLNFKTGILPWTKMLNTFNKKGVISKGNLERVKRISKACYLTKNYGDISKLNPDILPDFDLGTYSFPCTSVSGAGKQEGVLLVCNDCGEKFHPEDIGFALIVKDCPNCHSSNIKQPPSSLLWEFYKIIVAKKPPYLMMENVKALVGKKFKPSFDKWLGLLEDLGYNNYYKVINSKFCGIPQNRERVFCVSILKEHDNFGFHFYDDFDSGIRLKDILEDQVDEKYYLSEDKTASLLKTLNTNYENLPKKIGAVDPEGYSRTIRVGAHSSYDNKHNFMNIVEACAIRGRNPINPKSRTAGLETVQMLEVSKNPDINNCLTTVQKDTMLLESQILRTVRTQYGKDIRKKYEAREVKESRHNMRVHEPRKDGICNTLTSVQKDNYLLEQPTFRIRKLTPRECGRLMAVSEADIDKIETAGISNSQMYKMYGNSIVVDCMKFLEQLKPIN